MPTKGRGRRGWNAQGPRRWSPSARVGARLGRSSCKRKKGVAEVESVAVEGRGGAASGRGASPMGAERCYVGLVLSRARTAIGFSFGPGEGSVLVESGPSTCVCVSMRSRRMDATSLRHAWGGVPFIKALENTARKAWRKAWRKASDALRQPSVMSSPSSGRGAHARWPRQPLTSTSSSPMASTWRHALAAVVTGPPSPPFSSPLPPAVPAHARPR